jgi:hypothetical protein
LLGPEDPAVRSVMEEGRAILEDLGSRMLLDRLDALGTGSSANRASVKAGGAGSEERSATRAG